MDVGFVLEMLREFEGSVGSYPATADLSSIRGLLNRSGRGIPGGHAGAGRWIVHAARSAMRLREAMSWASHPDDGPILPQAQIDLAPVKKAVFERIPYAEVDAVTRTSPRRVDNRSCGSYGRLVLALIPPPISPRVMTYLWHTQRKLTAPGGAEAPLVADVIGGEPAATRSPRERTELARAGRHDAAARRCLEKPPAERPAGVVAHLERGDVNARTTRRHTAPLRFQQLESTRQLLAARAKVDAGQSWKDGVVKARDQRNAEVGHAVEAARIPS